MSVYRLRTLGCGNCGQVRSVKEVDSANPLRHPPFLTALMERTFNRFDCPECGHVDVVERPMLWTDVIHQLVAWMLPSSERLLWSAAELRVRDGLSGPVLDEGPAFVRAWGSRASIRLVFGLEELREKVVAHRGGVDDRVVEILKLPHVDPDLASGPVLEKVDGSGLHLATPPAMDGADPLGAKARTVAIVPWADYRRSVSASDTDGSDHIGLFAGTWVHWLRAPFPPGPVMAATS